LPNAVTIGYSAFSDCTSLTEIILPEARTIGDASFGPFTSFAAFTGCTNLTTVTLPKVETINRYTFNDCTALTTVILGATPPAAIGETIFQGAAASSGRKITFKAPSLDAYNVSPWSDKMGDSSVWDTYWDRNAATKANLTVALETL
jgi:hypothetical protein